MSQAALRHYAASHGSHAHAFSQWLCCLQGALELEVEGHLYRVLPGSGVWIPPQSRHDFAGYQNNQCLVLDLPVEVFPRRPTAFGWPAALRPLLQQLQQALQQRPDHVGLQAAVAGVLCWHQSPTRTATLPLDALGHWVSAHLHRPITVAELAQLCGWSVPHFHDCFRQHTGLTPQSWLRQLRLQAARQRLQQGMAVAAVAAQVGYASPSALTAALRRSDGVRARDLWPDTHKIGTPS
ncbi:helix-turn-helix domain-containing protein [Leeia aquatica]|uniref:AraC family transcriptional regulator n=1 Tax=Leeia aquatica TaxID=2725557 RepID=A0A847S3T1_9NEIS|nr:AraC family transcriptional regulator [Leeia aquatica]NLR76411.1 AraC family transcriptional regulator [Leeia aquatica]